MVAGGVKAKNRSDRYEAKGSIPKDADAVIHGHPDKDRAGFDSPVDGNVPLNNNKPNYVISRDRVGVTEFKDGALQFRVIEGTLTTSEIEGLQKHLDETQEEFEP